MITKSYSFESFFHIHSLARLVYLKAEVEADLGLEDEAEAAEEEVSEHLLNH